MLSWGEEILRCHVETEEVPRGVARARCAFGAREWPSDRARRRRSGHSQGDAAQACAPGGGRSRSEAGSADERGARGDQAPAPGEFRVAPRERDLEVGECVFRQGARSRPTEVSRYVDEHRGRFGVEPICETLGVSVSAYYQRRSGRRSARAVEDERLLARIRELHAANYYAYGYRRMWTSLHRAGEQVTRCRVQRLMKTDGIQGAKRRGKPWRTTRPDPTAARWRTSSSATSEPQNRISSGSPTSPTCAAGKGSSSSRLCSTRTA